MLTHGFYLILVGLLMSGCAAQKEVMNGIMKSWEGAQINDVVAQWGPPQERMEVGEITYFTWHYEKNTMIAPGKAKTRWSADGTSMLHSTSVTGTSTTTYTPPSVFHGSCDRVLGVDSSNRVVSWNWSGNNCPFMEQMEYSTWRRH